MSLHTSITYVCDTCDRVKTVEIPLAGSPRNMARRKQLADIQRENRPPGWILAPISGRVACPACSRRNRLGLTTLARPGRRPIWLTVPRPCGIFPAGPRTPGTYAEMYSRPGLTDLRAVLRHIGLALNTQHPSEAHVDRVRKTLCYRDGSINNSALNRYYVTRMQTGRDTLAGGYCGGPYDLTLKAIALIELEQEQRDRERTAA